MQDNENNYSESDRALKGLIEAAIKNGDKGGKYLYQLILGFFAGNVFALNDASYYPREDGGRMYFIHDEEDKKIRLEAKYNDRDGQYDPYICFDPVYLDPALRNRGIITNLINTLLIYGDGIHNGRFFVALAGMANERWKESLIRKGAVEIEPDVLKIDSVNFLPYRQFLRENS